MLRARPWAAPLIGLAVGWSASRTCAAREPFALSWSAPAECPSGAEVSAALERLAAAGSSVEGASVVIVPMAGRWQATLSTRAAQRRLEGESCGAVVQALTVVLALAAEQAEQANQAEPSTPPASPTLEIASSRAPAPPPSEAAPAAPAPWVASLAVVRPAAGESPRRGLGWGLHMGVLAEVGLLPGPSLGPRVALALHRANWSLELAGALLLPRHAELRGGTAPSSDIDWLAGQLALCRGFGQHLNACAGVEAGRLSGTGSGVDEPATARGGWLAATAEARLHGDLFGSGTLSWQLGLGVAAALSRPEFGFEELGVLHRPSAASARLFVGLGWGR